MNEPTQNMSIFGKMIFISLLFVFAIGLSTKTTNDYIQNHHVVTSICSDNTNKLATIQAVQIAFLNPSYVIIVNKFIPADNLSYLRITETNKLNEQKLRVQKIKHVRIQSFNEFIFFYRNLPSHSDEIPILV